MQAVFFVNVWPEPLSSAAGLRTRELSQFLTRLNYDVVAVGPTEGSVHSESWGVRTLTCDPNSSQASDSLREFSPSLVIYDRFYTEEKYGWRARELWPDALHILDTIDLHGLRGARQKAFLAGADVSHPPDEYFGEEYLREMASLHRTDVCLVVSSYETEWLSKQGFERERICYLPFSAERSQTFKLFEERRDFCFIGNYMHAPNLDAALWLSSELWPAFRETVPQAKLHLYGAYPSQAVRELHGKNGILVHGFVEDHRAAISQHLVMLAPLRFGAGIKGKVLEAWATGTPVLGTSLAFEGMGESFPEFTDTASFVSQLRNLVQEPVWQANSDFGFNRLADSFEREAIFQTLSNFIASSLHSLPALRHSLTGRLLRHHSVQYLKYFSKWIEEKNKIRSQTT